MNKGRIMRRTHRLRKLRKQRRILRQRFHLRFFYRDKWMAGKMDQFKPKIVVLTGAGISAESGIRTFRSEDGLWEEHNIEDVATPEGYARNPRLVQQFYNDRRRQLQSPDVQPNRHISPWRSWNRCWGITSCWSPRILITCMSGQVVSGLFICTASC